MFKNEIENLKKLKLNGTFEFIDCDKRKMIYVSMDKWGYVITIQNLNNKNFGMF